MTMMRLPTGKEPLGRTRCRTDGSMPVPGRLITLVRYATWTFASSATPPCNGSSTTSKVMSWPLGSQLCGTQSAAQLSHVSLAVSSPSPQLPATGVGVAVGSIVAVGVAVIGAGGGIGAGVTGG